MTKTEAKNILLAAFPKLTIEEQQAVEILTTAEVDKPNLRVEIIDETHQKFNGEIYTKREKYGYYCLWKTLHTEVMKYYNGGEIPDGYVIHHNKKDADGHWDRSQNNIEDLTLITRTEHCKIHSERTMDIEPKKAICAVCGQEFMSKYHGGPHKPFLCSKKCKQIWTLQQTEERTCIVCGKIFSVCKYKPKQCCSRHCRNILGHQNRNKN